jgi:tripartite-type tricarboxylate transporter receptor subunit TctC
MRKSSKLLLANRKNNMSKNLWIFFTVIFVVLFTSPHASSQAYPDRPVKIVVPNPPGGPTDLVGRLIGQKLAELWGQPVIIENKVGAGGNIGTSYVAKSKPDGYTVLVQTSSLVANMRLFVNPGYDLEKDLIGISNMGATPNIIVTSINSPIKSIKDLINNPKFQKINYGSPGVGTTAHLSLDYFFKTHGNNEAVHIGYKGAAPALTALMSGELDLASSAMPPAVPFVKTDKMRALAVTGTKRSFVLPNVPTLAEQGIQDMDLYTWVGLFVPKETPESLIRKIREDMDRILQQKDVLDKLKSYGFETENESMSDFAKTISKELVYWQKVLAVTGTKPQ